jgi:hypothetical protein
MQRGRTPIVGSDLGLILIHLAGPFEHQLPFPRDSAISVLTCRKAAIVCIFRGCRRAAFEPRPLILHHHPIEIGI